VSFNLAYGFTNAMFSMVMNACWILGCPSSSALANYLHVSDSNIVGKRVVLSLQMWETDTAADTLKFSLFVVW